MQDAFIVSALRTPIGRKKGTLSNMHPADLGAVVLSAIFDQVDLDPGLVEDVIFGCVDTVGPQAGDIARTCWLAAGLPEHVPGTTVDRQCGSSQQAVHFAAQAIMSGTSDVVVAGGVQNMNLIPISYAMIAGQALGFADPFSGSKGWVNRYGNKEVSQFNSAQMIAEKWNISRLEMENYAYQSHQKAMSAIEKGLFKEEIISVEGFNTDETPRAETSLEKMASLNPLIDGHDITAAISSQNADASSAILIVSEKILKEHNLSPLARIAHISVRADDPIWMLTAPMPATEYAVKKSGIQLNEIGLVEINEAFASVAMAWQKEMEYPMDQININGGAIALGHPLGATGARLMTTLVHNMKRNNIKYGLQTMCEGGGSGKCYDFRELLMNNLMNPQYPEGRNLFKDQNILITAAAGSGIGFSTAKRFLEEGANIFISDVHQGRLDEAIDSLRLMNKGEVNGCLCNVTNDKEIEAMFKDALSYYSNLNGVINNAGLGGESLLENMSNEAWDLVMNVTLNGAMKIMRAAIPVLKESQGVIVNNASVLGWRAQAGQSHYAAAKAGVMALTRCVALETVNHGIRINAVAPSLAMNPHLSKTSSDELIAELESKEAFGRGAEPWEIANIILFLASDLSSYMTGEVISASSQRA